MTTITREQAQKIIEAADEVISALAGTNEDVHPGSDNMLRLWDDLNDRYAPPEVVRELARIALASLEAEPVSQTYNLPELIEGMEVSIDVSTCDADLGNRYFGTVTEALELDTAKNGYILLVQDAEPNFDVNGNSPVIPDSWISCSERMPNDKQYVWCWGKSYGWTECNTFEGYYDWSRNKWWAVTDDGEEPASKVTHWMPLPEPPQEAE
ncbi:TPA: DUF551 domain-containing protein [Escherichia coli]|jgi:hypothetical protein|uniref:DUF551 domain-containing protein n=1 Tax=Salmonella enterica TaxID=28901 RepID=UPI0007751DDE|nr:DUF551 domain-containing protein [Salmonella enterica]EDS5638353.1 DUF551 domain-containing protein [Salmonella enterica subsp. enterica serovar Braenderup]EDU3054988.1 DUF551 domain-containing protein [Salmonella enterica subsp. enterica serovar Thompson]EER1162012.1 DUF551 domain-containing protein [Escherichia coli]EFF0783296.1 DUF551 domain-containing protein [Escherichia albertii]EFT0995404.1 DUF551 domain-containing protein [Shigella sonnei]EIJ6845963.1 DUF551 domain-containing prote